MAHIDIDWSNNDPLNPTPERMAARNGLDVKLLDPQVDTGQSLWRVTGPFESICYFLEEYTGDEDKAHYLSLCIKE